LAYFANAFSITLGVSSRRYDQAFVVEVF